MDEDEGAGDLALLLPAQFWGVGGWTWEERHCLLHPFVFQFSMLS